VRSRAYPLTEGGGGDNGGGQQTPARRQRSRKAERVSEQHPLMSKPICPSSSYHAQHIYQENTHAILSFSLVRGRRSARLFVCKLHSQPFLSAPQPFSGVVYPPSPASCSRGYASVKVNGWPARKGRKPNGGERANTIVSFPRIAETRRGGWRWRWRIFARRRDESSPSFPSCGLKRVCIVSAPFLLRSRAALIACLSSQPAPSGGSQRRQVYPHNSPSFRALLEILFRPLFAALPSSRRRKKGKKVGLRVHEVIRLRTKLGR